MWNAMAKKKKEKKEEKKVIYCLRGERDDLQKTSLVNDALVAKLV